MRNEFIYCLFVCSFVCLFVTDGDMLEARIWRRALNEFEIQSGMKGLDMTKKHEGLVGYWPLSDGFGLKVRDLSSYGHSGTIRGFGYFQFHSFIFSFII